MKAKRFSKPTDGPIEPTYPQWEEVRRSSRRQFLKRLGATAFGAGVGASVLSACGDRPVKFGEGNPTPYPEDPWNLGGAQQVEPLDYPDAGPPPPTEPDATVPPKADAGGPPENYAGGAPNEPHCADAAPEPDLETPPEFLGGDVAEEPTHVDAGFAIDAESLPDDPNPTPEP